MHGSVNSTREGVPRNSASNLFFCRYSKSTSVTVETRGKVYPVNWQGPIHFNTKCSYARFCVCDVCVVYVCVCVLLLK